MVLERMNRGAKNFKKIQEITGLERDELVSILKDLEKRRLMKVEEKSGLFGRKVELYLTDKGFKKYYSWYCLTNVLILFSSRKIFYLINENIES